MDGGRQGNCPDVVIAQVLFSKKTKKHEFVMTMGVIFLNNIRQIEKA